MAFQFVGVGASAHADSDNSLTLAVPSGVQEFDVLLAWLKQQGGTWSSLAWSELLSVAGTVIFWRTAPLSPPSNYTFDLTSSDRVRGVMIAYRGAKRGDEHDVGAQVNDSDSARTTSNGAQITTTVKNDLLVLFASGTDDTGLVNLSHPAGFTERFSEVIGNSNKEWCFISDGIQNAAGASGALDYTHDAFTPTSRHFTAAWKNGNLNKSHLAIGVL